MSSLFKDSDFDRLKTNQPSEFILHEIDWFVPGKPVVLITQYLGESNAAFVNAHAKMPELRPDELEAWWDEQMMRNGVTGWRNVAQDGVDAPYTTEDGIALLAQLRRVNRKAMINRLLAHLTSALNFKPKQIDPVKLGNE